MVIGRNGALSTLYHSCGFARQQSVLKTFPSSACLCSEDVHSLTMAFLCKFGYIINKQSTVLRLYCFI